MATTVAQPGTALRKIAKQYAKEAGVPVDDYLARLRRLNPDFSKATGSDTVRLGRGIGVQRDQEQAPGEEMPEEMPEEFNPNQVMNILDSPLYSQNLKDYYLSQYLPGLTEATFNINQAQTEFGSNEADRARQRGEAIRRVAGGYAARGMRSPGAINRDRSEIQSEFSNLSRAEQARIQALQNERDVMFGAGAQDSETFLSDPTLFGSIGAGARRSSLEGLQQLPDQYGLLGLGASRAPLVQQPTTQTTQTNATKTSKTNTQAAKQKRDAEKAALKRRQEETARKQQEAARKQAERAQRAAEAAAAAAAAKRAKAPAGWLSGRIAR
jgi:hypothetical protein